MAPLLSALYGQSACKLIALSLDGVNDLSLSFERPRGLFVFVFLFVFDLPEANPHMVLFLIL